MFNLPLFYEGFQQKPETDIFTAADALRALSPGAASVEIAGGQRFRLIEADYDSFAEQFAKNRVWLRRDGPQLLAVLFRGLAVDVTHYGAMASETYSIWVARDAALYVWRLRALNRNDREVERGIRWGQIRRYARSRQWMVEMWGDLQPIPLHTGNEYIRAHYRAEGQYE